MRKSKPTPIREVLTRTIESIVAKKQNPVYCEEDINKIWEKVAGKAASRHSSPAQIKGNVLVVNVDSPTWIYQLNIRKSEVEKKLNKLLKQKTPISIRLRAGED